MFSLWFDNSFEACLFYEHEHISVLLRKSWRRIVTQKVSIFMHNQVEQFKKYLKLFIHGVHTLYGLSTSSFYDIRSAVVFLSVSLEYILYL